VAVDYTIENTGGIQDTQGIEFSVNRTSEATKSGLTLIDGETASDTFTYSTQTGDAPAAKLNISTANDSTERVVTIQQPPFFDITIDDVNSTVTEGEQITVDYTVENTGESQGTQDITFSVNGTEENSKSALTLSEGNSASDTFTYVTTTGDAPAVQLNISSGDDAATRTTTVQEPAFFDIIVNNINSTVTEEDQIAVDYTVENTGGVQDTQDIEFSVNGTSEATESSLTLVGGETVSDTFTYSTTTDDAPAVNSTSAVPTILPRGRPLSKSRRYSMSR
jgi:CARDB.